MQPAAIKGTFADFKLVKTRKLAQVVIEIPIEEADHALAVLGGLPRSDHERWVAIARLAMAGAANPPQADTTLGSAVSAGDSPRSPATKRERTPAERAGFLCTLVDFQNWAWKLSTSHTWIGETAEEACAHWLRQKCGVTSRAQITTNPDAHEAFKQIEDAFHRRNEPPVLSEAERYA
jgi:hypothetical protein